MEERLSEEGALEASEWEPGRGHASSHPVCSASRRPRAATRLALRWEEPLNTDSKSEGPDSAPASSRTNNKLPAEALSLQLFPRLWALSLLRMTPRILRGLNH